MQTVIARDTRPAAELREHFTEPDLYIWLGQEYGPDLRWYNAAPPRGGDSVRLGPLNMAPIEGRHICPEDGPLYLSVPQAYTGDYCSATTISRSNLRVILRRWEAHVVEVTAPYSYATVMIRLEGVIPVELFDAIVALGGDYPLVDEDDVSTLESAVEYDQWDYWGRDEFVRLIHETAVDDGNTEDIPELESADYTDVLWAEVSDRAGVETHFEGPDTCAWIKIEDAASLAWEHILAIRLEARLQHILVA